MLLKICLELSTRTRLFSCAFVKMPQRASSPLQLRTRLTSTLNHPSAGVRKWLKHPVWLHIKTIEDFTRVFQIAAALIGAGAFGLGTLWFWYVQKLNRCYWIKFSIGWRTRRLQHKVQYRFAWTRYSQFFQTLVLENLFRGFDKNSAWRGGHWQDYTPLVSGTPKVQWRLYHPFVAVRCGLLIVICHFSRR